MKKRTTFATENNFYKASNLNTVTRYQEAGYRVEVIYVSLESAQNCKRRVANGGHNITDKQVEERFKGELATVRDHYQVPDKVTLLDNTSPSLAHNLKPLLTIEQGRIVQEAPELPQWVADIKNHIRQVEQQQQSGAQVAAATPQERFSAAAAHVAAGLSATGRASDAQAAAELQAVASVVARTAYVGGPNVARVEKAALAADQVPGLAGSAQVAELRTSSKALEQPMHERPGAAASTPQRDVPGREGAALNGSRSRRNF
ncbi:hypothetical protein BEN47_11700 [Hymenobacter lapidarius]|uniref:Zeta toxin domain-containing protein n=1 Tax=Hymenobacter lapidarius TaxID=1908237 RepID=A0A1G1T8F3_9BACT|nr:hypothetical protein [Hymenobacter lapidarius]OGX87138.1 hypothetical protein BEN47_11700 [Hymenobacter lapidarius]